MGAVDQAYERALSIGEPVPPPQSGAPGRDLLNPHRETLPDDAYHSGPVLTAPKLPSFRATPQAVARIIVARYREGQSLQQLATMMARQGAAADRTMLSHWVRRSAEMLRPVASAIRAAGLRCETIACANGPITRQIGGRRRLWLYMASAAGAPGKPGRRTIRPLWFQITPDRLGGYAKAELADFQGLLQAPTAMGYESAVADGRAIRVGCWGEIARQAQSLAMTIEHPVVDAILERINDLRQVEREAAALSDEDRADRRRRLARPVLERLHAELAEAAASILPRTRLGLFITSVLAQWESLSLYLDNGAIALENGAAERIVDRLTRGDPWIMGRHPDAPLWLATLYTILESCAANAVDEERYLTIVLTSLPMLSSTASLETLLPWNFRRQAVAESFSITGARTAKRA